MATTCKYTVRVNENTYIGQKVVSILNRMKKENGMSFNAIFIEALLRMSDDYGALDFSFPERKAKSKPVKKEQGTVKEEKVQMEQEVSTKMVEPDVSDDELYAMLGNAFGDDY